MMMYRYMQLYTMKAHYFNLHYTEHYCHCVCPVLVCVRYYIMIVFTLIFFYRTRKAMC